MSYFDNYVHYKSKVWTDLTEFVMYRLILEISFVDKNIIVGIYQFLYSTAVQCAELKSRERPATLNKFK